MNQLKFGVVLPRYNVDYSLVKGLALRVERMGFDSVWLTDHLQPPRVTGQVLETWTTLAALAVETSRVRLGTSVLCCSYRHPSLLAKMAATLDVISNGRLELGIGIGSEAQKEETASLGMPFPSPTLRVRQLKEYVEVLRRLWTIDEADFEGRYFSLKAAVCNSKPLQRPHPPLWIGGRKPFILRAIAEVADHWNFYGLTPEEFAAASRVMEEACSRKGRDPKGIMRSIFSGIAVASSDRELHERVARAARQRNISEEDFFRESYTAIYGTPSQCVEGVHEFAKLGASHFILRDYDVKASSILLFAKKVLPYFRREGQG